MIQVFSFVIAVCCSIFVGKKKRRMALYKMQLIETGIALLVYITAKIFLRYAVRLTIVNSVLKGAERKDVLRLINLIMGVVLILILVAIWSVKQENVLLVASSLLTVFGVALFAEMSILSNVTACIILFFQHPIKVGDTINFMYEGQELEGELVDITYFFMFIKTPGRGTVTVPNALFLKSSFTIVEKE